MMAKIHEVKLHAKYFDLVLEGKKRAEFRKNDRNYERGDTLILHEWVQGVFTGRKVEARITDVTDLSDWLEDYVLLSIELLNTGAYKIVNWKELSERGLVFRINHEIMHQLGLAVMYEPETGCLAGQWLLRMGYGTIQMNRWSVQSKTGGLDNAQNTRRDTAP
ncbi:ASCH domain protein [Escherichia coli P0299917.5]|nr:ASCH domain protein [Escherichia coli P0299917.10]ENC48394.1 ASCH domain protein [Escherichia coli P0299917.2]ENC58526.1 ASCH domain protein [Escherichia coli P0299917.4]ENC62903.1 ASCH domain protein [Escherichia coli P0299917.3]ENC63571.1 ASCH domain protein [Escherichia coli P0299917.5]ENC74436.1 ASCH domain protein [Escherichia coli P0299917.8]ENC74724.1 ASCH domain protein [Escherichia coli P0299917.6]ENC81824.1 ASCH domain protein [Escherichia coli P0299917.7]ENC85700.1 ASCH domain